MVLFNKELKKKESLKSDYNQYVVEINESFIFTTCHQEPLLVYDWSLNLIKKIGQNNNPDELFYLSKLIINVKTKNNCYYVFEKVEKNQMFQGNSLKIFDQNTGNLLQEFQIDCMSLLNIDSNQRLIFGKSKFNSKLQSLVFISQKGEFLKDIIK